MITVGLVKELYFISRVLKTPVEIEFTSPSIPSTLLIKINNNVLDVEYACQHIWHETIEGDTSFFGVESCDTIARIMACINNGTSWEQYRWDEKPLTT